jgi:AcrR family transcriptional regulator
LFEHDPENTRDRILHGAYSAIGERGIGPTKVQHILDAAGVSRRTFYQYFRSKDDVLAAVYGVVKEGLIQAIAMAVVSEPKASIKVNAGVAAYVDYQRRSGRGLMELQAEAIRPDSPLAPHRESTLDAVVGVVDEAVKQNVGLACDPLVYRAVLMGIEGMVIHLQRDGDFTVEDGERINAASIALIFQILEGIKNMPVSTT